MRCRLYRYMLAGGLKRCRQFELVWVYVGVIDETQAVWVCVEGLIRGRQCWKIRVGLRENN